jgi:NTE family protein
MKKISRFKVAAILFLAVLYSCMPVYNAPDDKSASATKTADTLSPDDKQTLMLVTFSGGGTRAAAMSWKVLETLKNIPYTYRDKDGALITSNLADEIDYISGISGGSFAAAAWCLYKKDMNIFRDRFIKEDVQGDLLQRLFIPPWQGLRLLSPHYDRAHIAAEFHDKEIFDGKTFAELPARPVLWIHATNLALGTRFTFTKKYFDLIASDLSKYPIGYACAASSAFPILLSPMTLINYGNPVNLPDDINYKMAKMNARDNIEQDHYCRMREFFNNKENKFIHLADGGIIDNQGLQSIIDEFGTNGIINKKLNDRNNPLKRLIIINVNAGVAPDDKSCKSRSAPPVTSVIEYTMVTSMDDLSAKRWMQIKELCQEIYKAKIDIGNSTRSLALLEEPYTIEINFRNVKNDDDRAKCQKLPTSFYLKEDQLELIDRIVPGLVREDPAMIRLINALKQERH